MIKLEHVVLPSPEQMEFVIEGMRNPMNSWDKSDSELPLMIDYNGRLVSKEFYLCGESDSGKFNCDDTNCEKCDYYVDAFHCDKPATDIFDIGPNDLSLMQKLSNNGPVHSKYMRMMPVMVRITAPLYWWKEFDTYKVGTVANSCSTMHKITEREFMLGDFSIERSSKQVIWDFEGSIIPRLNNLRRFYNNWDSMDDNSKNAYGIYEKKDVFNSIIQLLPSSYNQTRNVMLNYEVLKNIYIWRKNHKLDEWVEFCKWIETLPYSELITGES